MNVVDELADENAELRIKIKDLEGRLKTMAKALDVVVPACDSLHHPKRYQHAPDEPCPAEALVRKAAEARL